MEWNPIKAWKQADEMAKKMKTASQTRSRSSLSGPENPPTPGKAKQMIVGCLGLVVLGFICITVIGLVVGDDKKPDEKEQAKASAAVKVTPTVSTKKKALDFAQQISDTMGACQIQRAAVTFAISRRDSVQSYEVAGRAAEYCGATRSLFARLNVPAGLPDQSNSQFHGALDACGEAMDDQATAFRQMQAVLDSQGRVSEMAHLDQMSQQAGASLDRCSEDIESAAVSGGATKAEARKANGTLHVED